MMNLIIIDTFEPDRFKKKADLVDDLKIVDIIVQGVKDNRKEIHLFQRKEVSDFFSTLMHRGTHNREAMWETLRQLREYENKSTENIQYYPYILIEGELGKQMSIHKIPMQVYVGTQRAITSGFGIPIVQTLNQGHTWMYLESLNKNLEEPKEYIRPPPIKKKGRSFGGCQEDVILVALNKFGRKKAQLLLEEFGSVRAVVNADAESITKIRGIGKNTAKKLCNVFQKRYGG